MKIDFLVPGSANDHFFSNIAFMRRSLDALGGDYSAARIVAALGEWTEPEVPARWQPHLRNVDIIWSNPERFPNPTFTAQHFDRFNHMRVDADIAIACDADVCFMRPFGSILKTIAEEEAVAGVMAHFHFPTGREPGVPADDWRHLSRAVLGKEIALDQQYLFNNFPNPTQPAERPMDRPAPFYVNYGVVIGSPAELRRMHMRERELIPLVKEHLKPYFAAQVSLALACADLGLRTMPLPARYNYPNRPESVALVPGELEQVVAFHYLYQANFKRSTLFAERAAYEDFVRKELVGADAVFRDFIRSLNGDRYPFG